MKVTTKLSRLALSAAVAGFVAGQSMSPAFAEEHDGEDKVEANGCGGPNGCGQAKDKGEKADSEAKSDGHDGKAAAGDANGCGGPNGCGSNE